MENKKFKSLFNDHFYKPVYEKWRLKKEKAGKDIVGEEYENFRRLYYSEKNCEFGIKSNVFECGVNTDKVIMKNGEIMIIEEEKGSYVDGTFLKRAVTDAAIIYDTCLQMKIKKIPYFILSSTTKMQNYSDIINKLFRLYDKGIQEILENKFIYLPLCEHGRVDRKIYFKSPENHFVLSEKQLKLQEDTINKIIQEF
jgi:hypothetical protein